MSNRYAPLPNPRHELENSELDAAFNDGEDDEEGLGHTETSPLTGNQPRSLLSGRTSPQSSSHIPGTYDFESADYDYPPPGSPPAPSALALPNSIGNSNGLIPPPVTAPQRSHRDNWIRRTAASLLPSDVAKRLGLSEHQRLPAGPVGSGVRNDGVFANVTAKPSRGRMVQDGEETYIVPETSQNEAPPSYASAQADAVPPYWETTVHAPFMSSSPGEVVIETLPTGTLFSFLWNALISVSFQFVGFLLTYLLHTTHAARFGSRAGLGITLIQYGFSLRSKLEDGNGYGGIGQGGSGAGLEIHPEPGNPWHWPSPEPPNAAPTFATSAEADEYYKTLLSNGTTITFDGSALMADATTEWLSFFLMTVGWFLLLTSVLGYWRVKRWERSILASAPSTDSSAPAEAISSEDRGGTRAALAHFRSLFRGSMFANLRGAVDRRSNALAQHGSEEEQQTDLEGMSLFGSIDPALEGDAGGARVRLTPEELEADPARARRLMQIIENERRLQEDLRAAGLL